MVCTMMLLMMLFKITNIVGVYFRVKMKWKVTYRFLSRMKLELLLYDWWQAENIIKCKRRTRKEIHKPILKMGNYFPRAYARTKCLHRSNVRTKRQLCGYVIVQAMCTTGSTDNKKLSKKPCEFVPDTESLIIGLDNHTTCCMELNIHNLVTKLTPTPNIIARGVGNQLTPARGRGEGPVED
jgi:hypothetical protein